jgi:hypothetical protein
MYVDHLLVSEIMMSFDVDTWAIFTRKLQQHYWQRFLLRSALSLVANSSKETR